MASLSSACHSDCKADDLHTDIHNGLGDKVRWLNRAYICAIFGTSEHGLSMNENDFIMRLRCALLKSQGGVLVGLVWVSLKDSHM